MANDSPEVFHQLELAFPADQPEPERYEWAQSQPPDANAPRYHHPALKGTLVPRPKQQPSGPRIGYLPDRHEDITGGGEP